MSVSSDMATAVEAAINAAVTAGTLSPWTFAAERTYSPPTELTETQGLIVLVMASAETKAAASRNSDSFRVTVQTAVCKKIDSLSVQTSTEQIDALMDLVESINDVCRSRMTAGSLLAGWQETRRNPTYDAERLQTNGVFLSVSEHDYFVVRNVP